ncbi:Gfo/Idh/MocA family protein [Edaphobacter albus]|uniref:Gfo/Idh/MocA family protein n=1 Tax=Edaphobacter sp. 4G125 TaxID=2763071 RepID=UPI001646A400|nr:Gfo/Idh/MocA family oxidoreductase [Edaphobacter sp. 4G125]QNI35940.1 Gfo/Idh/MocA family oxidoreductase [Edaphobacter sp. 4G125]
MINRRLFVQGLSAATLVAKSAGSLAEAFAGKPMRLGIIGPGSRGKELVRSFLRVPGVKIVAAADVYEPRFAELNQVCGYTVEPHKDYRALVDRKDLDAVVVSTPLSFHAEHVLAALRAGHSVYGEKTMAFTVKESEEIVRTVDGGKQIFQVGHQYRYAPWIRAAIEKVQQGEIGDVTHVFGYWHRNSDWRRPVPQPSLERLINWRLYNQYSLGLLAELASHHIDIANWVFGEKPETAMATGSVVEYHDGRENDDNVQAILGYSKGRRFVFSSMTNNAKMGDQLWIYGTKGSVNLTLQDAVFFYEPRHAEKLPANATVTEKGITTGASYRSGGEMPYRGPGKKLEIAVAEDPTATACRSFVECLRTGAKPIADVHVGLGSALGVIVGNESIKEKRELKISSTV